MTTQKLPVFVEVPAPDTSAIEQQIAGLAAQLQLHDARLAALEAGVVPEPEPELPDGIAVTLPSGEQWSGLTDPPAVTTFRTDHPRLLITPETISALQTKLADPLYQPCFAQIARRNNPTDKAFLYAVYGDETVGREAIDGLLAWKFGEWHSIDKWATHLQGVLMYDWLYNLMTPAERTQAEANLSHLEVGIQLNSNTYYHSDTWHRGLDAAQFMWALASDSEWAIQHRQKLLDPDYKGFKLFQGGALDVLTTIAMSQGGGWHGGNHRSILHGYEFGFVEGGMIMLKAWESVTGDSMTDQTTIFHRIPYDIATRMDVQPSPVSHGKMLLEWCTGLGGETAGLSASLLDRVGQLGGDYAGLVTRMIFGDRRVAATSPDVLGLPLWGWRDGGNYAYVRTSWDADATAFLFFARHWDRGRYEQSSSHLAISKSGLPVLPLATNHKNIALQAYTQLRVWNPGDPTTKYQGLTYWGDSSGGAMPSQAANKRASSAADVVDPAKQWHRPETLTNLSEANGFVTATTRFEKLLGVVTPLAERTVVIDPHNETVLVTDRVELAAGLATESNFGLTEEPTIIENVIENSVVRITVQSPFIEIVWDAEERETDTRGTQWTIGTVKIRPVVTNGNVTCEMLVEVK